MAGFEPGEFLPELIVETISGGRWRLSAQCPPWVTLLAFYGGRQAEFCKPFLTELDSLAVEFRNAGVEPIALSRESRRDVLLMQREWNIDNISLGYDVSPQTLQEWGLSCGGLSVADRVRRHSDSGLFFVLPQQRLLLATISSHPAGLPAPGQLLDSVQTLSRRSRGTPHALSGEPRAVANNEESAGAKSFLRLGARPPLGSAADHSPNATDEIQSREPVDSGTFEF